MSSRYHHPMHSPVFPSQMSSYSTLTTALTNSSQTSSSTSFQFLSSKRRRVPQTVSKSNPNSTFKGSKLHPISFDYLGQTGQGVSLADLNARSQNALVQMISGANDTVLAGTQVNTINLRIMWIGYEHLSSNYIINVPSQTVTRGQLGASIAQKFSQFVTEASRSSTTNPHWQINSKGIQFDKILLVAFYHITDDVWQADVAVDF